MQDSPGRPCFLSGDNFITRVEWYGMVSVEDLAAGKRRAVARALSVVENRTPGYLEMMRTLFPHTGKSNIIGVTGPAGAGKSSLIDQISTILARRDHKVAVLAIDPTSHITGGAILGDRVRMTGSTDSGVYIRSMASRGARGALSAALRDSIRVLEYAGYQNIIVESVGAGQTEVDISTISDVTVVVFNPHTGDSIQTIKAGITEIGDICVINKSDLPASAALYDAVRDYIGDSDRNPIILKTSVKDNTGMEPLCDTILDRLEYNKPGRAERQVAAREAELRDMILTKMYSHMDMKWSGILSDHVDAVKAGQSNPYDAAERIAQLLMR